jgi:GntR family transcriptional regulator / MocR family aminotransferase
MELTPFIKKNHEIPIYLQLYHYFREEIESGKLVPGTKLPSIRQLSEHLQISKNTVETAYQQLTAEGYLESKEKSGLFVIELEEGFQKLNLEERMEPNRLSEPLKEDDYIDFQYGDIDLEHFPYKIWKKCLSEAIEYANQEVFSYGDKKGLLGLRKEIASYLYQARGVRCSPDQIILSAGTQTAISLISQILELPHENVAIENPGYDGVRLVFESHKCQLKPIPLEDDGINLDILEETPASCVYVTPSHQFPIGMILPIQKRLKLLQWAEKNQSYIIEDDYDGEFRYIGHPIPSLKSLDTNDRVIYLGTFSKAFLPAARVSYMVLPEELVQSFQAKFYFYNQTVSPLIQEALYRFMKDDHFGRHIRKMRKIYQKKQKALLEAIENYLGNRVTVIGQKAGLHLLLDFKEIQAVTIKQKAKESGVKLYLTEKFWFEKPRSEHLIMVGFGGLTEEDIQTGIKRIASILEYKEILPILSNK